ncbi:MAG: sulfite exporter TauE/SafE family protein [Lachnospiraceae bacterium]|nr:sulfite exporter TauE/SafE family protein [Lachnospiraceae bacterium]
MWLWILATVLAYFVKGLCGFANTLVFTSILSFGTTNINISPVELLIGYPSNIILTWKNRKKLDKKIFIPLIVLVLLGSIPGAFLLKTVNPRYVKIVLGVVIILLGVEMLLRDRDILKFRESKAVLFIIGLISGVLCGMFGIGALLAAYVGKVTDNSDGFKANMSIVFIFENTFRIVLYSVLGIITLSGIKYVLMLLPLMLLGLFLGMKSSSVLKEKTVKTLVVVFLIISGIMMIVTNL